MVNDAIGRLVDIAASHEKIFRDKFHLTPSENFLSPLARAPYLLDVYGRYFLDDVRLFGAWFFPGGREIAAIDQDILLPTLRRLARARFVTARPISGLNCMTIAVAALTRPGDTVFSVPLAAGGHASTPVVASRLGVQVLPLPMAGPYDLDLDRLAVELREHRPSLIYLDQSTLLFPLDPRPVRDLVDRISPNTLIHYDSSHTNGLILFGALPNPLEQGADSFGGSTHKSLPGPHKGFLATNRADLMDRIQAAADHFVSHSHMADALSLAFTLIELEECGGAKYSEQVIRSAKAFAEVAATCGMEVAAADRGFTACHQVWLTPERAGDFPAIRDRVDHSGFVANSFNALPSIGRGAFRLSLAETTRLGLGLRDTRELARLFCLAATGDAQPEEIAPHVMRLRHEFPTSPYCFTPSQLLEIGLPQGLASMLANPIFSATQFASAG